MKKYLLSFLFSFMICSTIVSIGAKIASANMLLTPTMVVFDGRDHFATITLVNTGQKENLYELGWEYFNMKNGGGGKFVMADKPATDFDLSKHIVFAPKRVRLAPGAKQKVRLALRRPADIPDGDYHVHLKFASIPDDVAPSSDEPKDGSASIGSNILVSYAIPVVFRSGKVDVQAEMGDISLKRKDNSRLLNVSVPISRSGKDYSILGSLFIYHLDDDGKEELVGELSNAYIFPEASDRIFDVSLTKEVFGGSLKVVLRNYDKKDNFTYVERVFPIK